MTTAVTVGHLKPVTYSHVLLDTGCKISAIISTNVAMELAEKNGIQLLELSKPEPVSAFQRKVSKANHAYDRIAVAGW